MTVGYAQNKDDLRARLRRIEGQVGGIQRMVDEDRYCIDILTQVNAVKAARAKVALALLGDHVEHCVADAMRRGKGKEKVGKLTAAIGRCPER
ncbi:MAG TPA: metal-sensitive transcriptional regulator [Candidatus Saccharimonadales bacterium]|nr:metal-sensitive transcriptional regulator [Candidatus Saccharimonadales bacterium]